jgi:hypothetical protein
MSLTPGKPSRCYRCGRILFASKGGTLPDHKVPEPASSDRWGHNRGAPALVRLTPRSARWCLA